MPSLDLRQILPPKMPFFVRQKVQISLKKNLPRILNFADFVKFRQKSVFSSRRPVSFRQFFVKKEILWSLYSVYLFDRSGLTTG